MRVTKIVREYIEEQVAAKFPTTDDNHPYVVACKKFEAIAEESAKKVSEFIENELANVVELYGKELPEGWTFACSRNNRHNLIKLNGHEMYGTSILKDEYGRWQSAQREKRRKAIQDIIVTLELGGSKADLERMLGELGA